MFGVGEVVTYRKVNKWGLDYTPEETGRVIVVLEPGHYLKDLPNITQLQEQYRITKTLVVKTPSRKYGIEVPNGAGTTKGAKRALVFINEGRIRAATEKEKAKWETTRQYCGNKGAQRAWKHCGTK